MYDWPLEIQVYFKVLVHSLTKNKYFCIKIQHITDDNSYEFVFFEVLLLQLYAY